MPDYRHALFEFAQRFSACVYLLCFVHLNTAAAQGLLRPIVIDSPIVAPDVDAEGVGIVIIGRDHELVTALAIDRAFTLELCLVAGDHQPFVAAGVEVQIPGLELELGVAVGHIGALLVLGHEAEVGFAAQAFDQLCRRPRANRSSPRR